MRYTSNLLRKMNDILSPKPIHIPHILFIYQLVAGVGFEPTTSTKSKWQATNC